MIGGHSRKIRSRQLISATLAMWMVSAVASAQNPATPMQGSADADRHHGPAPAPPFVGAGKNHEQGVVLLKILVAADGSARSIEAAPDNKASPELTKAASDAASKWQFPGKQENGKATETWVKVPVFFSFALWPPHPPGPPHGGMLPPTGLPTRQSSPNS